MKKALFYCVLLFFVYAHAQLPNQNFNANQLSKIISPQMGKRHLNQPSVISGHAVLAGNGRHQIWNISNPFKPFMVKEFTSNHSSGEAESHQVSYMKDENGNLFLITISGKGIDIWEINDIKNPKYISAMELPGIDYGDVSNAVWGISCQGDIIYVGATNNGLYVVDASNKSNPTLVKTMSQAEVGGILAGPLFNIGNLLVITTPKQASGISTLDISDSKNPILLDTYIPAKERWRSYIGGFYGKYATLVNPFRMIDVTTDPSNIKVVSTTETPNSEYVTFDDDYLFLGGLRGGSEGIWKYDISNPLKPVQVSRIKGRDSRWDDQFSCPVGNLLIITDDQYVGGYVGGVIAVHDTKKDTKAPKVEYVSPVSGATNQSINSKIGISFSSWINFNKINTTSFKVRKVGGAPISGSFGWTYTTVTFEPSKPLESNTEYEIVLETTGVEDLVGNKLKNRYVSRFTTEGGIVSPTDISIKPSKPVDVGAKVDWGVINPNSKYQYKWETGDGNEVTGTNPDYSYTQPGRYNVLLSAFEAGSKIIEAESATTNGGVNTGSGNAGFSGTGYLDFPSTTGANVYAEVSFNNTKATTGELRIGYAMGSGNSRPLNLSINGGTAIKVDFVSTGGWTTYKEIIVSNITIPQGNVTLRLSATAGRQGGNIDYFKVGEGQSGLVNSIAFTQIVNSTATVDSPRSSSQMVKSGDKIWVTNEDANTISSVSATTLKKVDEITVGKMPVSISDVNTNRLWVLNKEDATISIINTATATVINTISLPFASQPSALVVNNNFTKAYVTLECLSKVLELNIATSSISKELKINPDNNGFSPKLGALAIDSDGQNIYISRFVSENGKSEIYKVATTTFNSYSTISLKESTGTDGALFARGIPNYLTHIAIAPDGKSLRIASKKDNIKRGLQRDGLALEHDNTVRAITSYVDLNTNADILSKRLDIDNSDRCHSVTYSSNGGVIFIAMPGNNEIFIADANDNREIARLITEEAPTYTLYDNSQQRLYAYNFLGRSISVFDVKNIVSGGSTSSKLATINTVSKELLTTQVLEGKKLFYDATSTKLSQEGYVSCASCHLGGGNDGQVWDFSNLGEGFRNTIDLKGKGGLAHGPLHWTANFDEIHDFENQIRTFNKGTGLLTDQQFNTTRDPLGKVKAGLNPDLDALAAYITSLDKFPESPYKQSNGSLTPQAQNGKQVFTNLKCFECHSGQAYTNSAANNLFDVGTINTKSGKRIDKKLLGIDVPTLKGLWATAPYLHDGSAATLREVLTTKNVDNKHMNITGLSTGDLNDLLEYLKQLDDSATNAPNSTLDIAVVAPTNGQQFDEGQDININISSSIPNINNVEYFIDDKLVANETTAPFNHILKNGSVGIKEVKVKAYFGNGTGIVSDCLEFEIKGPSDIANGVYHIKKASSNYYLKAIGVSGKTTGVSTNTEDDTKWTFTALGNNEYSIKSVAYPTGRLEVPSGAKGRGIAIETTGYTGEANHIIWIAEKVGTNYILIPKHDPSVAIDVYEGNTVVHTWDKNINNANQIITLVPASISNNNQNQFTVNARGIVGEEQITLSIGDTNIKTWTLSKVATNYTVSSELEGNVRVTFINNAGARDVFVDYIKINDVIIEAESRPINTAAWQNGRCGGGGNSEWMNCGGYIDFGDASGSNSAKEFAEKRNTKVVAYPIPAEETLHILNLPNGKVQLSVATISGQVVYSEGLKVDNGTYNINVSNLNSGVYILVIDKVNRKEFIKFTKK